MHFFVHNWINTETFQPMFGLQVEKDGKVMYVSRGNDALFFDTKEKAQTECDRLNEKINRKE